MFPFTLNCLMHFLKVFSHFAFLRPLRVHLRMPGLTPAKRQTCTCGDKISRFLFICTTTWKTRFVLLWYRKRDINSERFFSPTAPSSHACIWPSTYACCAQTPSLGVQLGPPNSPMLYIFHVFPERITHASYHLIQYNHNMPMKTYCD